MMASSDVNRYSNDPTLYAAADLGSNSFHLVITRCIQGNFYELDRARAVVRLVQGISEEGCLDPDTEQRAFDALRQFGFLLQQVPVSNVRVVGTNAVRLLSDGGLFVKAAGEILGLPIDIISGNEEARLINLGVATSMQSPDSGRLIIDIGGGSTEVIIGNGTELLAAESLSMGCVTFSRRFFPRGKITGAMFNEAQIAAGHRLAGVMESFSGQTWSDVIGTSGTIKTVRKAVKCMGLGDREISMAALDSLIYMAIDAGHAYNLLQIKGISQDRSAVFIGGLAILKAVMNHFAIRNMQVSKTAMREGIVFDLMHNNTV